MTRALTAFVLDDEPLAVKRLVELLRGRVDVVGSATDPADAVRALSQRPVDVLFLDIHMPEMDGFAVLERLSPAPMVVFTTAHDEHALRAFQVLAVDYLLKPIARADLDRALDKLERLTAAAAPAPDLGALVALVRGARAPGRIATRLGDRVTLHELERVSHFRASDRATYAVVEGEEHILDETLSALERRLDPARFFRIHRNTLVNLDHVAELVSDAAGVQVRLRDRTELAVARDRVRPLKDRLGI